MPNMCPRVSEISNPSCLGPRNHHAPRARPQSSLTAGAMATLRMCDHLQTAVDRTAHRPGAHVKPQRRPAIASTYKVRTMNAGIRRRGHISNTWRRAGCYRSLVFLGSVRVGMMGLTLEAEEGDVDSDDDDGDLTGARRSLSDTVGHRRLA